MDPRSADRPTRRWIGRGRGVLSLSSQQTDSTEKRPGNLGGGDKAQSVNQSNGSVLSAPTSQRPASGEQRLTTTANNRPTRRVADRQVPVPAATDQRRQQSPTAANRGAPQASSSSSNGRLTKPQMQNSTNGSETEREKVALLAGYSYKANPASPLGFPELNIRQGQKLALVEKHATNEHWWKVESEEGAVGYVPANYVMTQEKKPSTLPWLRNKEPEEDIPAEKPAWKAYVSAYDNPTANGNESKDAGKKDYYCPVCDKTLNGPKPYGAHMASKAHKEEVEVAREMGREV